MNMSLGGNWSQFGCFGREESIAVAGIPPMDHPAHGLVTADCANPAHKGPQMVTEFL